MVLLLLLTVWIWEWEDRLMTIELWDNGMMG